MNEKEINDLIDLYFSLEVKKKGTYYMFGEDSEFSASCRDQFLRVSHKVIENDLQSYLLEKIENDSGKDDSDFKLIDFSEFGYNYNIDVILLKDVYLISHVEFNIIVYYSLNEILDLTNNSNYWSEINRLTFLTIYEKEFLKLRRNPVIDSILL